MKQRCWNEKEWLDTKGAWPELKRKDLKAGKEREGLKTKRCVENDIFSSLKKIFHHWRYVRRSCLQLSNILPSLMLRSKILSSIFKHSSVHWCYALRSSLQFSNMLPSLILCSGISFSSSHSSVIDATLQHCLFNFQSFYLASWMLRSKIFSSTFKHSSIIELRSRIFSWTF